MDIRDICIGDSCIASYRLEHQTMTMVLRDYCDTSYEIVMTHCDQLIVNGSVGFSLSEGSFSKSADGHHWCFQDEDGAVMELRFKAYAMKRIAAPGSGQ
ncbi:MAG: hypothetical protein JNM58_07940 [Xanthomonadaceae bacterium]|nr:hypothetical protein [Xanthomonadaceae bacterium]